MRMGLGPEFGARSVGQASAQACDKLCSAGRASAALGPPKRGKILSTIYATVGSSRPQTAGTHKFPFREVSPHSALTYTPELRAKIAARTERHESVDRCTTLELGFNRERAVQDLQPLIHAD